MIHRGQHLTMGEEIYSHRQKFFFDSLLMMHQHLYYHTIGLGSFSLGHPIQHFLNFHHCGGIDASTLQLLRKWCHQMICWDLKVLFLIAQSICFFSFIICWYARFSGSTTYACMIIWCNFSTTLLMHFSCRLLSECPSTCSFFDHLDLVK